MMAGIIPYSEWGSRGQGGATIGPVGLVIVHHWYRPHIGPNAARSSEAEALRGVERYHSDTNGWGPGTGYQFHAFGSGRKWEGRGWRRSGAHTVGKNGSSVAIALPIDGDAHEPTAAQTQAVEEIIREGLAGGHITAGYRVRGHRDYSSKSCPGDRVSDAWLRSFEGLDRQQPEPTIDIEEDEMLVLFEDDNKLKVLYTGSGRIRHLRPEGYEAVKKLRAQTDQVVSVGEIPGLSKVGFEE